MADYSANLTPIYRISKFLDRLVHDTDAPEPVYRIEFYLAKLAGQDVEIPEPIYRIEFYLAKLCGMDVEIPVPIYRAEFYLAKLCGEEVTPPDVIYRISHWLADWAEAGGGGSYYTLTGTLPLTLPHSLPAAIRSLVRTGAMTQTPAPTPDAPVYPVINNGTVQMVDDELPAGYKRLTGLKLENARFVTNIFLTGASTLRFSASGKSGNWIGAFSSSSADDNYSFYATTNSGGKYLRYDGETYNSSIVNDTRYDIAITPTGITGNRTPSTWAQADFACSVPLCIGAIAPTQTPGQEVSFYGSIFADDAEIIPVERESDGVLGYFVNGAFLTDTNRGIVTSLGYDNSHLVPRVVGDTEVLTVSGKNLLKLPTFDELTSAGQVVNYWNVPIKLQPNTTYYLSAHYLNGYTSVGKTIYVLLTTDPAANSTYKRIAHKTAGISNGEIVTGDSGYLYLRVNGGVARADYEEMLENTETQLELGTEATAYEPYKEPQTASVVDLYAVGDYRDEVDVVSGTVTRNVGMHVFDGTENFVSLSGNRLAFVMSGTFRNRGGCVCTHFPGASGPSDTTLNTVYAWGVNMGGDKPAIWFRTTDYTASTLKTLCAEQFAAGTPLIAWFVLQEPTTKSVTPQALRTQDGTTVVSSSAGSVGATVEYKASQEPTTAEPANGLMMAAPESEDGGAADGS